MDCLFAYVSVLGVAVFPGNTVVVDERKDLVDGSRISVAKLDQNAIDQDIGKKWLAVGVSNRSKLVADVSDCDPLDNGRSPLADRHHAVPARLPVVIAVQRTAKRIEQSRGI